MVVLGNGRQKPSRRGSAGLARRFLYHSEPETHRSAQHLFLIIYGEVYSLQHASRQSREPPKPLQRSPSIVVLAGVTQAWRDMAGARTTPRWVQ